MVILSSPGPLRCVPGIIILPSPGRLARSEPGDGNVSISGPAQAGTGIVVFASPARPRTSPEIVIFLSPGPLRAGPEMGIFPCAQDPRGPPETPRNPPRIPQLIILGRGCLKMGSFRHLHPNPRDPLKNPSGTPRDRLGPPRCAQDAPRWTEASQNDPQTPHSAPRTSA